jgi:hypothetical protein
MAIFYTDTASIELLTVTNLTATTSSISYFTQSQLNVENNLITVNTNTPQVRFGGLAVIDSGSTNLSGSLLFDSQNNQWIYIHQSAPGADVTSSVLIMGPQTFNNVGGETTITTNRLTKGSSGDLGEHITSSNVTDTGTLVSINSNTEVTGSLIVTAGLTGSLLGTASWAGSASQALTASYLPIGTYNITSSWAQSASQAISSSYALSASYAPGGGGVTINNNTDNYILTATGTANTVNGEANLTFDGSSLIVTGSVDITGSLKATTIHSSSLYTFVGELAGDAATGANQTPVSATGLVFTYEANSIYEIRVHAIVQPAAATTGCGFQFDLSSAVTSIRVQFYHQLANTGTLTGGHSIADDASVGVSSGMPGTSTYPVFVTGLLETGANTGTAQLRFRSEVNAVTTLKAGTVMIVQKIF